MRWQNPKVSFVPDNTSMAYMPFQVVPHRGPHISREVLDRSSVSRGSLQRSTIILPSGHFKRDGCSSSRRFCECFLHPPPSHRHQSTLWPRVQFRLLNLCAYPDYACVFEFNAHEYLNIWQKILLTALCLCLSHPQTRLSNPSIALPSLF